MSIDTEATDKVDYTELVKQKVRLVYLPEVEEGQDPNKRVAEEIRGVIETVNDALEVIMIRQRGKMMSFLVEYKDIVELEADDEPGKPIRQKTLKPVDSQNARQHLADRHGYELAHINAMTDEQAEEEHDAIDHSPLGHTHRDSDSESEDSSDSGNSDQAAE